MERGALLTQLEHVTQGREAAAGRLPEELSAAPTDAGLAL